MLRAISSRVCAPAALAGRRPVWQKAVSGVATSLAVTVSFSSVAFAEGGDPADTGAAADKPPAVAAPGGTPGAGVQQPVSSGLNFTFDSLTPDAQKTFLASAIDALAARSAPAAAAALPQQLGTPRSGYSDPPSAFPTSGFDDAAGSFAAVATAFTTLLPVIADASARFSGAGGVRPALPCSPRPCSLARLGAAPAARSLPWTLTCCVVLLRAATARRA